MKLWTLLALLLVSTQAHAVTVVGVIASERDDRGVVLLRRGSSSSDAKAYTAGQSIDGMQIKRISRDFVFFKIGDRIEKVRVGENVEGALSDSAPAVSGFDGAGFEKQGNRVVMTSALREHLVKSELGKILMQAAAVPYFADGELRGFRFWEIDKGSVFDQVGLKDGDIITIVNGQPLTDVANTLKLLNALKQEPRVDVTYLRDGVEQSLEIVVQ